MEIPLGARREERVLVTPENAINFLGMEGARVLSTPHMIGYLEMTVRNLIKQHVPAGEDSVGTVVNVKHIAATPIGMSVRLTAEVTAVEGRRVTCRVEAWDESEKVGEGDHERFVIDVARFAARVQAKAAARA
ncbi:MAG TPA: thioesterase family protein [Bryobacteraceae bacterium]|nr:thioesterase family protein [Bryobacteraceae bacterium]